MENKEEQFKELQSKEMKLRVISAISALALGLGLQASIAPPSPIPFLQSPSIAYAVLGFGIVGLAISSTLIIPIFRKKVALSNSEENS